MKTVKKIKSFFIIMFYFTVYVKMLLFSFILLKSAPKSMISPVKMKNKCPSLLYHDCGHLSPVMEEEQ